jgi:hypothetical protein
MDENHFYGPIPASISNASDMTLFQLDTNLFDDLVPLEVGLLKNLIILQIYWNSLHPKEPKDWEFMAALTNYNVLVVPCALQFSVFEGMSYSDPLSQL